MEVGARCCLPESLRLCADPSTACNSVDLNEDLGREVALCCLEGGALGVVYSYPSTSGDDGVAGLSRAVEAYSGSRVESQAEDATWGQMRFDVTSPWTVCSVRCYVGVNASVGEKSGFSGTFWE